MSAGIIQQSRSEFKKHFNEELNRLHLVHYHTYPKTPKMNAHVERFNRTIQEEFVDYHMQELIEPEVFNKSLIDWLVWYNTERPHYAFKNKLSPVPRSLKINQECKTGWTYTRDRISNMHNGFY